MPGLPGVAGDAVDLVRKRPAIAVGAGVAILVAVKLLNRGDAGTDAAATDTTATDGGLLGGGLGSVGYPGMPSNGDLQDTGVVTTPTPTPTTPTTPTTPAKVAYQWAHVDPMTLNTYVRKGSCYAVAGSFTTAGFGAEFTALGTVNLCAGGSSRLIALTTGVHAGKIIGASRATITTKYR